MFLAIVFLAITAGLLYGIHSYGNLASPLFWIAGIAEVFLAFLMDCTPGVGQIGLGWFGRLLPVPAD